MSALAAIILAAGGSTRMGSPKQLLRYQGQTLLRRTVQNAIAAGCSPVIVVVGASAGQVIPEALLPGVTIIRNPDWKSGMGTSIRTGVAAVSNADAALILLCDQPHVHAAAIMRLIDLCLKNPTSLIAAEYADTIGVPAIFSKDFFGELATLTDDQGAKAILLRHHSNVIRVKLHEAQMDVDTPEEYEKLRRM